MVVRGRRLHWTKSSARNAERSCGTCSHSAINVTAEYNPARPVRTVTKSTLASNRALMNQGVRVSRPFTVSLEEARPAFLEELECFQRAVQALDDQILLGCSHAHGWSRLDCLVHVRMGLQELLAGIPARSNAPPDTDAASYWAAWEADADEDLVPGILMTRRTASAYSRPRHALEHLDQVIAGLQQAVTHMPDAPVLFQQHSLNAGDLLATWAVELVVHHHDLNLSTATVPPARAAVAIGRRTVEAIHDDLPDADDDLCVVLAGFGRV